MDSFPTAIRRFALHGHAIEISNEPGRLQREIAQVLREVVPPGTGRGKWSLPITGSIRVYHNAEVEKRLSPKAVPVAVPEPWCDLYQDNERYWLIDDQWGLTEINLLKRSWQSWILPNPGTDAQRCLDRAVLWPMAQLMRGRGLYLMPGAAVVRDNFAVLILSPFGLEPELTALVRAGYRLLGQRWVGLSEEQGRMTLQYMPGCVQRFHSDGEPMASTWVDLAGEYLGSQMKRAACDAVLVVDPIRRPEPGITELNVGEATSVLRRAWPISELHSTHRFARMPARLAEECRVCRMQLSRQPNDLLSMLNTLKYSSSKRIMVSVNRSVVTSAERRSPLVA